MSFFPIYYSPSSTKHWNHHIYIRSRRDMGSESSYHPSTTTNYGSTPASGIPSSSRMSTDPSQASFAPSTASYETSSAPGSGPFSRMTTDPSQASSVTVRGNPIKVAVRTQKAPPPTSLESQAIICQGMVNCSGQIGVSPVRRFTEILHPQFSCG